MFRRKPAPDPIGGGYRFADKDMRQARIERMRILLLCRSLGFGGTERQLILLANGLAERGHVVTVASFYVETPGLQSFLEPAVECIGLGKRGRFHVLAPLLALRRAVRARRPDVVCGFLPVPNLATLAVYGMRPRPRIVWGLRASDMDMRHYDWLSRLTYRLEAALHGLADLAIVNSQAGLRVAERRGYARSRLTVVYNGVDTDRFRPDADARRRVRRELGIPESCLLVGHVARIDPMKDHAGFVQAMGLLARRRDDVRALCVAAGTREQVQALRQHARESRLETVLQVVEATPAIEEVLAALDVFCLSSRFGEGFPNVVVEAMACGVPCVVTAVGDAAELVGDAGEVSRPGDAADLADRIERMLVRLRLEGEPLRHRNRSRAQDFSIARLVDATERILAGLVEAA
jgi:glycosyltransferase involved in cell wall biosynthesis